MLKLKNGSAAKRKIAISEKFWTTVHSFENFRVLRGVKSFTTPLRMGFLHTKKHSWRVLILGRKKSFSGTFLVQNVKN